MKNKLQERRAGKVRDKLLRDYEQKVTELLHKHAAFIPPSEFTTRVTMVDSLVLREGVIYEQQIRIDNLPVAKIRLVKRDNQTAIEWEDL